MASIKRKELERQLSALHSRLNEKQKKLVEIQGPAGTKTGLLGDVRAKMETIKAAMKEQQDFAESTQPKIESLISEMEKKQLRINELLKDIEYKDRAKLESHISTLEHQYNNSKMNIKDERQIVSYIDKLKRSRKKIEEFQRLELDIVSMKAERTKLRQQKGKAYSDYNHMKKQLGQLQGGYKAMRRDAKTLKMDVEFLFQEKRKLLDENEANRRHFVEELQLKSKKEESKKPEDLDEVNGEFELFAEDKRLCRNLISYLDRYLIVDEDELADSDVPPFNNCSSGDSNGPENALMLDGNLRRLDVGGETLSVSPNRQRKKNSKRDKRKANQLVPHTPEVFAEFAKLNMNPPSTYADVHIIIAQLKEELHYLDQQTSFPADFESVDGWTYPSSESGMTDSALNSFDLSQSDISGISGGYSLGSSRLQSSLAEENNWEASPVRESHSCADFLLAHLPETESETCELQDKHGGHGTDMPDGFGRSASDSNVRKRLARLSMADSTEENVNVDGVVDTSCNSSASVSPIKVRGIAEEQFDEGIEVGPEESKSSSVESSKGPTLDNFLGVRRNGELGDIDDSHASTEVIIEPPPEVNVTRL